MRIVEKFTDVRGATSTMGLVPTLGFIHEGHLDLMRTARAENELLVASLFVNPLQFNEPADFDAYPRDLERDASLMESAGVDVLFAPTLQEMYPSEPLTRVHVDLISDELEGAHRPGHFEGVATVVTKLLAGIQPDRAYFGKKDAQQLAVVTRLVVDLSLPVEIIPCSTVREVDGLALSSRNVRIESRTDALKLSQGLFGAASLVGDGERHASVLERRVRDHLVGLDPEYVTLASRETCQPIPVLDRPAFLAVACAVGDVRLIDNIWLDQDGSADLGKRLSSPSSLYGRAD